MGSFNEFVHDATQSDIFSEQVNRVIAAFLSDSDSEMAARITDPKIGDDYRGYLLGVMLDVPMSACGSTHMHGEKQFLVTPKPLISPNGFAKIYDYFGLINSEAAKDWLPLHGHLAATTAAALTIANRMLEANINIDRRIIVTAALVHDIAKGKELEEHGVLASSLENIDRIASDVIRAIMKDEGITDNIIEKVIICAANTGRQDRQFATEEERRASIEAKGVEAAIVGLADARTVHMDFLPLQEAQGRYLKRKKDVESQYFFTELWLPYYRAVSEYLTVLAPHLDLDTIGSDTIYRETITRTIQDLT